jgi:PAS domain S-box-containing protein
MEDISARKQAEAEVQKYQEHLEELVEERTAELRESEQRYSTLFDGVPIGLYRSTPEGRFLDVNLAMVQMLRYPNRETLLETKTRNTYVEPVVQDRWMALMEQEGVVRDFETHGRRYDGTTTWFSDSSRAVKDEQDNILYYEGKLEDITERKNLELEIRRQKDYFEALFVNSPVAIVTADLEGTIVSWNPAAEKLFKYSQDEVVGRNLDDIVSNNDSIREEGKAYTRDVIEVGRVQATTRRTRKDGSMVDVELSALPVIVGDEKIGFISIYLDLTERKQYEEEISRQKEYFEALFVNSPVAIVTADLEGTIVSWNPTAEKLFQYSQDEVIGRNLDDIVANDDSIREEGKAYTRDVIEVGRVQATTRRTRKDGSMVDVELLALPVIVGQERIGFISIYVDIADLQAARREAEAANKAKSIFLANMSHELRTPLNAILGFTQLMDQDPNLTSDQQDNLRIINQSGGHLLTLINDVLEMSKIEAGRQTIRENSFDIHLLLDSLEEIFRVKAIDKDLGLTFERADNLPQYIVADANRLRQVLMNLLGNAVKFTKKGGVTLRAEASPQSTPSWTDKVQVQFEVEDTGPGIAPEELKAVFEPFVQVINDEQYFEGTGLGLSISRQYVRLMGGDLTVTSAVGQGSTFKFNILAELADEVDVPEVQPIRRVIGVIPGQPNYRLLIVEDRDTNRQLLRKILHPLGFELKEAINGEEAIELWKSWSPHLIFMDMQIPIIDGFEATKEIKETQRDRELDKSDRKDSIIIALTASAFEEDREKILSVGCDDFIRKPFQIEAIYELLAKHLSVEYQYADESIGKYYTEQKEDLGFGAERVFPEDFAKLPDGLITTLRDAVIKANLTHIHAAIQKIQETEPQLSKVLQDLANNFDYKKILKLIDQSRDLE